MKTVIRFDLFKVPGGKWAYGGTVEVEDYFWAEGFLEKLIINQKEVVRSTFDHNQYYLVTRTLDDYTGTEFYLHLFQPWELMEAFNEIYKYEK